MQPTSGPGGPIQRLLIAPPESSAPTRRPPKKMKSKFEICMSHGLPLIGMVQAYLPSRADIHAVVCSKAILAEFVTLTQPVNIYIENIIKSLNENTQPTQINLLKDIQVRHRLTLKDGERPYRCLSGNDVTIIRFEIMHALHALPIASLDALPQDPIPLLNVPVIQTLREVLDLTNDPSLHPLDKQMLVSDLMNKAHDPARKAITAAVGLRRRQEDPVTEIDGITATDKKGAELRAIYLKDVFKGVDPEFAIPLFEGPLFNKNEDELLAKFLVDQIDSLDPSAIDRIRSYLIRNYSGENVVVRRGVSNLHFAVMQKYLANKDSETAIALIPNCPLDCHEIWINLVNSLDAIIVDQIRSFIITRHPNFGEASQSLRELSFAIIQKYLLDGRIEKATKLIPYCLLGRIPASRKALFKIYLKLAGTDQALSALQTISYQSELSILLDDPFVEETHNDDLYYLCYKAYTSAGKTAKADALTPKLTRISRLKIYLEGGYYERALSTVKYCLLDPAKEEEIDTGMHQFRSLNPQAFPATCYLAENYLDEGLKFLVAELLPDLYPAQRLQLALGVEDPDMIVSELTKWMKIVDKKNEEMLLKKIYDTCTSLCITEQEIKAREIAILMPDSLQKVQFFVDIGDLKKAREITERLPDEPAKVSCYFITGNLGKGYGLLGAFDTIDSIIANLQIDETDVALAIAKKNGYWCVPPDVFFEVIKCFVDKKEYAKAAEVIRGLPDGTGREEQVVKCTRYLFDHFADNH